MGVYEFIPFFFFARCIDYAGFPLFRNRSREKYIHMYIHIHENNEAGRRSLGENSKSTCILRTIDKAEVMWDFLYGLWYTWTIGKSSFEFD